MVLALFRVLHDAKSSTWQSTSSMRNLLIALLVGIASAGEAWDYDENVAVLNPDNFDVFISSQEYTIVGELYARLQ